MTNGRFRPKSGWALATLAIIPLCVATLAARSHALSIRDTWPPEIDALYLPPTSILKRASLGHTELMSDLVSVRANVYFGDQLAKKGLQKWLFYYVDTATDLDPYFHPLYMRGAVTLVFNGNNFTLEGFERGERLLEKGIKYFPGDWELWFQLGFNKAFEMDKFVPRDSKLYKQFKREGAEAIRRATLLDGIPPHLPNVVATMLTKQGERELAIEHLKRILAMTSDPDTRANIRKRLISLMGEQFRDTSEMEVERLKKLVEQRYPYAHESFSLIAGPRGDIEPFVLIGP